MVLAGIIAGIATMMCTGAVAFLLTAPPRREPLPPPVARPTPPALKEPVPAPAPTPPEPSASTVVIPEPTPAPAPAPAPKKPAPARPLTNEEWGAQRLAKKLKSYDYCGREAILRKQDIPRRYQLRAKFDANGEGMEGRVDPAPVAMLNACIKNRTKYVYLGKPPQPREFEVELTLSFAHLRPKGKPETRDDQWSDLEEPY